MRGDLEAKPSPTLAWADHDGEPCLRLAGLAIHAIDLDSKGGEPRLAVVAGERAAARFLEQKIQPAAGHFVRSLDGVDFIPRFPFLAGATYRLIVAPCPKFPDGLVLALQRPSAAIDRTATVTSVYPDVEAVPLNLLKLYLHFSEPMAEGSARRGVSVHDVQTGGPLEGVFLDMDPELWDPERRRLTLLLDPGRIKRGLGPHQAAGYPLTAGAPIRLTIGAEFRSAAGAPLRSAFTRVYAIGPALRRPVDPENWRLNIPDEGSLAPLKIEFDRPLDHAMLEHAFQVVDPAGRVLAGAGTPVQREMGWTFWPSDAWRSGEHGLIIEARLEDLAGNSLRRVFDRDLTRDGDFITQAEHIALSFRCHPPALAAADAVRPYEGHRAVR